MGSKMRRAGSGGQLAQAAGFDGMCCTLALLRLPERRCTLEAKHLTVAVANAGPAAVLTPRRTPARRRDPERHTVSLAPPCYSRRFKCCLYYAVARPS